MTYTVIHEREILEQREPLHTVLVVSRHHCVFSLVTTPGFEDADRKADRTRAL